MSNLRKIINLLEDTDKLLILDENGEPKAVLSSYKSYKTAKVREKDITDLTDGEFLDKINRDIELWKENQKDEISSASDRRIKGFSKIEPFKESFFGKNIWSEEEDFVPDYIDENYNENSDQFENEYGEEKQDEEEEDHYYFEPVE